MEDAIRESLNNFIWRRRLQAVEQDIISGGAENIASYRAVMVKLANEGKREALERVGTGCNGGDEIFPCDWDAARDCFLTLMENDWVDGESKLTFALNLGEIYYYGKCTDGAADYENAFRFLSIAALGGIEKAQYLVSDMLLNGYGTYVNGNLAGSVLYEAYNSCEKSFQKHNYDGELAETAIRVARMKADCWHGALLRADEYYMIAMYALEKRKHLGKAGDAELMDAAKREMQAYREKYNYEYKPTNVINAESLIFRFFNTNYTLKLKLKSDPNGVRLMISRKPHSPNDNTDGMLYVSSRYDYCELLDELELIAIGAKLPKKKHKLLADRVRLGVKGGKETYYFHYKGELVYKLKAEEVVMLIDKEKGLEKKYNFVSVGFDGSENLYDYLCDIDDIKRGDSVIVPTTGGERKVTVYGMRKKRMSDMPLPDKRYKKVLRKAED